ncbi:MAG: nuclear transport factor 2 family protein [Pseudomonadota bacterium]
MSTNPVADYDAITEAVSAYIEGGRTGSGATTKKAFHDQANIFGYLGGNLLGPDPQKLYDARDKVGPAPDLEARFTRVDVTGTAANVRLDISRGGKPVYTDYLNMAKLDGAWTIVSKVFHMHG